MYTPITSAARVVETKPPDSTDSRRGLLLHHTVLVLGSVHHRVRAARTEYEVGRNLTYRMNRAGYASGGKGKVAQTTHNLIN